MESKILLIFSFYLGVSIRFFKNFGTNIYDWGDKKLICRNNIERKCDSDHKREILF